MRRSSFVFVLDFFSYIVYAQLTHVFVVVSGTRRYTLRQIVRENCFPPFHELTVAFLSIWFVFILPWVEMNFLWLPTAHCESVLTTKWCWNLFFFPLCFTCCWSFSFFFDNYEFALCVFHLKTTKNRLKVHRHFDAARTLIFTLHPLFLRSVIRALLFSVFF